MPRGPAAMPVFPGMGGGVALAAHGDYVYVLRGNTLYQFAAEGLELVKKVTLEEDRPMVPGRGPGMGPGRGPEAKPDRPRRPEARPDRPRRPEGEPAKPDRPRGPEPKPREAERPHDE